MTVLQHRGRPHGEAPEASICDGMVEAGTPGKMPTLKPHGTADNKLPDNSNAKPQRPKVSFAGKSRRSGK